MNKLLKKLKRLDKTGIKLSVIVALNWLVKNIVTWQFLVVGAFFIGLCCQFAFRTVIQEFPVILVLALVFISSLVELFNDLLTALIIAVKRMVLILVFFSGFYFPVMEMEKALEKAFYLYFVCGVIYLFVKWLQPKIFNAFLFKQVLNKEYLGIRNLSEPLPPEKNVYSDADEKCSEKRMQVINQYSIRPAYQDCVELTFLNTERITGVRHYYGLDSKERKRVLVDIDEIYYPIFTIHPFGKKVDFCHRLVEFKLSRKTAFTSQGTATLKSN